jgi:hypothetical protein
MNFVKFEVLTAVNDEIIFLWDLILWSFIDIYQGFGGNFCFHIQDRIVWTFISTQRTEVGGSSATSVPVHLTAWYHNEDYSQSCSDWGSRSTVWIYLPIRIISSSVFWYTSYRYIFVSAVVNWIGFLVVCVFLEPRLGWYAYWIGDLMESDLP